MEEFFADKGLPYEAGNMEQLFSAIATAGAKSMIIAQVASLDSPRVRYFYGYCEAIASTNLLPPLRRVRKYHVINATTVHPLYNELTRKY